MLFFHQYTMAKLIELQTKDLMAEVDLRMEIVGDRKPVLIADLLRHALPFEVTKRVTSKSGIAERFTKSWAILSGIIANTTLGRKLTHQLEAYLSLMGRLESTAEHAISEADEVDRNSKSVKLTGRELHRPMLGDRATKPIQAMSSCAKCGHCLVYLSSPRNHSTKWLLCLVLHK